MDFFSTVLSPFVFIIEQIFLLSYSLTGSYGWSIVVLSFTISAILLPIFIIIEKAKKRNDAIRQRMKAVADEIKRCYKGKERYYYLKTLNKQHGYNPIKALIPILSLLVQIPFFIAAYQFLGSFEPLEGQGFLFINDLNAPDGLFGSINILPIAMTIVNVVTAYLYTINGDKSERYQMYGIAGVFLVLLFKLPSGLVLYWTLNNVFSFLRLFITNPEVFKSAKQKFWAGYHNLNLPIYLNKTLLHAPKFKILFLVLLVIITLTQVNWAMKHSFDDFWLRIVLSITISLVLTLASVAAYFFSLITPLIISRIKVKASVFFTLLFFAFYFHFASQFYFTGINNKLAFLSIVFFAPIQAIGISSLYRSREHLNNFLTNLVCSSLTAIIGLQAITLLLLLKGSDLTLSVLNMNIHIKASTWLDLSTLGILFSLICGPFLWREFVNYPSSKLDKGRVIFLLSVFYVCGLIFFWNPLIVYSSYPDSFEFPAINILYHNLIPFVLVAEILVASYLVSSVSIKSFALKLLLTFTLIAFLYSSIIPFDAGVLNVSHLTNEKNLAKGVPYFMLEACLIACIFYLVSWLLSKRYIKTIVYSLVIVNLMVIGHSLYLGYKTGTLISKEKFSYTERADDPRISFSKTKENLIVFVIDGAQAWYMIDLAKEDPSLRNTFSGFVHYPNTLATANYTYASVPSIMCGHRYSIANMNKDEDKTILEKVSSATEEFYDKIKGRGFDLTSTVMRYSSIDRNKFDTYLPRWHDSWTYLLGLDESEEIWYTRLWENAFFASSPLFLKPRIYNNTKWIMKEKSTLNLSELNEYNFVRALPLISNTTNNNPNFIYIHSLYTHDPWNMIDENESFIRNVTPYESQRAFTYSFAKWIQWMKENDVYNNTKIILVSDHGPSWWHYNGEITTNAPIVWTGDEKISLERFLHLNSLLMVKDYGKEHPLKKDWRLMSIADVSAIAFQENDPTKTDSTSRTIQTFYTTWHQDLRTRTQFELKHAFEINNWVYDLNNWTSILEE